MGRLILLLLATTAMSCARTPIARHDPVWSMEWFGLSGPGRVHAGVVIEDGQLKFGVKRDAREVIEASPLSFVVDGVDLCAGVGQANVKSGPQGDEVDETYPTRGVHSTAVNRFQQSRMSLRHAASGTKYRMDVRVFDDGVAYRFVLDGGPHELRTPDERSVFTLPAGSTVWSHGMRGHYEGEYTKRDAAGIPAGEWVATPLTVKLPDNTGYASISESNVVNSSGFALESVGERKFVIGLGHRQPPSYPYTLRYAKEDVARVSQPAKIAGTITTPWRVVIVAADLNALVNSDIISNLAEQPDPKLFPQGVATDWVKPGRAVWEYLDRDNPRDLPADPLPSTRAVAAATKTTTSPATTRAARRPTTVADMKLFSRLASELGFEYNVLEGFWSRWSDDEIRDLVGYSRQQGVGIFVWVHSRNLYDPSRRAALFKRLRDTGVVGLKVDFFDHEHKEVIDLYQALLREGAENKILFDFHGANKPAGESRTWPNEMTREAVRGLESRIQQRAVHQATIPFTRYVVGPAEYTPLVFHERRGDTTVANQIASVAILSAPLLTLAAHPQKILDHPAVDVIKSIPATWDETIVLAPSEVGELAAFARRMGDTWFVAVMNGPAEKSFDVPLKFLGDGGRRAAIVSDDPADAAKVHIERNVAKKSSDTLQLTLRPGGGFVARFDKE